MILVNSVATEAGMGVRIMIEQGSTFNGCIQGLGTSSLDNLRVFVWGEWFAASHADISNHRTFVLRPDSQLFPLCYRSVSFIVFNCGHQFLITCASDVGNTSIANSSTASIFFDQLVEIDNMTGALAQVLAFPGRGYEIIEGAQTTLGADLEFAVKLSNFTSVKIGFVSFENAQAVPYANSSFTVGNNTVKWIMQVLGWPFVNSANVLRFEIQINTQGEEFVLQTKQFDEAERVYRYSLYSNETNLSMNISLSSLVILDNETVIQISEPLLANGELIGVTFGEVVDRIAFIFPQFNSSLLYDPDFSVTLKFTDESDGGDGDGDGDGDGEETQWLYLIAIAAVVPLVLVVALVIVISAVIVRWVKNARAGHWEAQAEMVQWGSQVKGKNNEL
jgi:hypothetical protein